MSGGVKVKGIAKGVILGGDIKLCGGEGPTLQSDITTIPFVRIITTANLKNPSSPSFTLSTTALYRSLAAGLQTTYNGPTTAALTLTPTSSVFFAALWAKSTRPTVYTTYTPTQAAKIALKSDLSKEANITAALALTSSDKRNTMHVSVAGGKDASEMRGYGALSHTWQHITSTVHASGPLCNLSELKFGAEMVVTED
eukprot:TRINITY_DN7162_c5_g1_i1.p1 TRINITY_DN7162_c5_g1~~TRINITY_DN7162_c5_g1_i1.p1  ORF type:complete len:220 (+),score=53.66 TRINITY_DN7162_c5_g1_i1:67-660(+)